MGGETDTDVRREGRAPGTGESGSRIGTPGAAEGVDKYRRRLDEGGIDMAVLRWCEEEVAEGGVGEEFCD